MVPKPKMSPLLPGEPLDLLLCLSWRYLVPQHVLDRFNRGCINVHRGALPTYAGAIPVQRAIEAGESRFAVTTHEMVAEIDSGDKIAEVWLDLDPSRLGPEPASQAEVVKRAFEPLYAPLVMLAVESRIAATGD